VTAPRRARDPGSAPRLIMLAAYWAGGWSMALDTAPSSVHTVMGPEVFWMWCAMLLICPPLTVIGMTARNQWAGTILRVAAGTGIGGALAGYTFAVAEVFGWGTFFSSLTAGLTFATAVLVWRDLRRLWRITHPEEEA
jgi:hypothetical protein